MGYIADLFEDYGIYRPTKQEDRTLGFTEFLVGINSASPSNLPDAISDLEDTSTIFHRRWTEGDYQRAGDVSKKAMALFDFITNELLREQVKRKGLGTYLNSAFSRTMDTPCGSGVTGASQTDQEAMVRCGPGNGILPLHLGNPRSLTLSRLLNKIKHRNPQLMNFRFDNGDHIFIICPEVTGGGAEGIYEFSVAQFCDACRQAARIL